MREWPLAPSAAAFGAAWPAPQRCSQVSRAPLVLRPPCCACCDTHACRITAHVSCVHLLTRGAGLTGDEGTLPSRGSTSSSSTGATLLLQVQLRHLMPVCLHSAAHERTETAPAGARVKWGVCPPMQRLSFACMHKPRSQGSAPLFLHVPPLHPCVATRPPLPPPRQGHAAYQQ